MGSEPTTPQADSMIAVARRFDFVREIGGPNRGHWVQFFQRFTGNAPGDSWCASFVSRVMDIAYDGTAPLHKTSVCAEMLAEARGKGMVVATPQPGHLYFYVTATGHAHHVGIVTSLNPLTGIAGNTSQNGLSSNGDGVYEHGIFATVFAQLSP